MTVSTIVAGESARTTPPVPPTAGGNRGAADHALGDFTVAYADRKGQHDQACTEAVTSGGITAE